MPSYLVETFLPRGAARERLARDRRASSAAEALTREGARVRFGGSIHVPEDELCLFTFEAPNGITAALAAHRAGLDPLRVVRAVPTPSGRHRTKEDFDALDQDQPSEPAVRAAPRRHPRRVTGSRDGGSHP